MISKFKDFRIKFHYSTNRQFSYFTIRGDLKELNDRGMREAILLFLQANRFTNAGSLNISLIHAWNLVKTINYNIMDHKL